ITYAARKRSLRRPHNAWPAWARSSVLRWRRHRDDVHDASSVEFDQRPLYELAGPEVDPAIKVTVENGERDSRDPHGPWPMLPPLAGADRLTVYPVAFPETEEVAWCVRAA